MLLFIYTLGMLISFYPFMKDTIKYSENYSKIQKLRKIISQYNDILKNTDNVANKKLNYNKNRTNKSIELLFNVKQRFLINKDYNKVVNEYLSYNNNVRSSFFYTIKLLFIFNIVYGVFIIILLQLGIV